ncbi:MAG: hypothetical protein ABL971_08990 [Vicinamibacterales bacterium]
MRSTRYRRAAWRARVFCAYALLGTAPALHAQTPAPADKPPITLEVRSFIYADNTEFLENPYRLGETLLGAQVRADLVFPLSSKARFIGGMHSNSVGGDDDPFEKFRPVAALELDNPFGTFTIGTIRSGQMGRDPGAGLWPEDSGPHGLVPALQLDTLSMTRSYEFGVQMLKRAGALQYDGWMAWQRLNTSEARERIDAGVNGHAVVVRLGRLRVRALGQMHVVHEGGQLFDVGTVGDSLAGGVGAGVDVDVAGGTLRVEGLGIVSKYDPDRGNKARRLNGSASLVKLIFDRNDWHGLFMAWHGSNVIKWEGDPNYASLPLSGGLVASRDYKEMSASRRIVLSPQASLLTNVRFYRIDGDWDYAYRIVAAIKLSQPLRRK